MKYCVFCMLFNQFQKVLIFSLFWSSYYKIYSLQDTSVNTIPILQYTHFIKYHKKELLSQTLVCCYIMALLFLETLLFFDPALFWLVENIFELIFIGLTLLLILYMDVISHVKSVMKVGFREQINYMKFMKVCVLVLQKQLSIKSDFAIKFIKCQTILISTYIFSPIKGIQSVYM